MVGTSIENYRIDEILGHGGMGVVYKAMDTSIDRIVALKVMNPSVAANDEFLWRFKSEAKVLGRLIHSNIVNVYAFRHIPPHLFIVMEHVDGGTLSNLIDNRGALTPEQTIPIITQCLDALEMAHNANIIHRDIKPQNILLTQQHKVKISDFGLAKIQENTSSTVTRVGVTGGTIYYMPPEQSVALSDVDHRGDLYSLGMTMYQMLAGRMPFDEGSSTLTILRAIDEQRIPTPSSFNPGIPKSLADIVMRAIKKEKEERFQSAAEMREALLAFKSDGSSDGSIAAPVPAGTKIYETPLKTQVFSPSPGRSPKKSPAPSKQPDPVVKEQKLRPALLGIGLIALVALAIWGFSLLQNDRQPSANEISVSEDLQEAPSLPIESMAVQPAESLSTETRPVNGTPGEETTDPPQSPAANPVPAVTEIQESNQLASNATQAIQITSTPSGAQVFIDGRSVGTTPYTANNLNAKNYQLRISQDGYETWSGNFNPASRSSVDVGLVTQPGEVKIVVRPFGNILINGSIVAENTNAAFTAPLVAGTHTIQATHAVLGTWQKQINVKPGVSEEIFFNFNAEYTVTVISSPLNAEIIVDGKSTNRYTPSQIKLRPGNHTISVQKSGYTPTEGPKEIILESEPSSPISFELQQNQ